MPRKKKLVVEDFIITVSYICPNNGKNVDIIAKEEHFSHDISSCDLCGSHGYININPGKCPHCGSSHTIVVTDF